MPSLVRNAIAALALLLLAAACAGATDATTSETGSADAGSGKETVADLAFTSFDGVPELFGDHLGTPMVINFFAEWCPNCIDEMPDFESVSQSLEGRVGFVGISIDQTPDAGRRLVAETGVTYTVGWDPSETLLDHFEALAMPTTVFVRADGTVARVWSGGLDAASLTDLIDGELL